MQFQELYTTINYLRSKQNKLQSEINSLQKTIDLLQHAITEDVGNITSEVNTLKRTVENLEEGAVSATALILSDDYAPSDLENKDLHVLAGDTYETAVSKLHKSLLDDEKVTAAAISTIQGSLGLTAEFAYSPTSSDLEGKTLVEAIDYLRSLIS